MFWAAEPGFPFYPPCTGCIFVSGTGSSCVSLRPPTKISAAASPGCHSNPCRGPPSQKGSGYINAGFPETKNGEQ